MIAKLLGCSVVALCVMAISASSVPTPLFDPTHLDRSLTEAYYVMPMDVNADNLLDVVAITTDGQIVWYENPSWTRHPIVYAPKTVFMDILEDVDGDGLDEIVFTHNFGTCPDQCTADTGAISYVTRPKGGHGNWTMHYVGSVPGCHRVRAVDVDGDGVQEIIGAPVVGVMADPNVQYRNSALNVMMWRRSEASTTLRGGDRARDFTWNESKVIGGLHALHQCRAGEWEGKKGLFMACLEGILFSTYDKATDSWATTTLHQGDTSEKFEGASEVATGMVSGKPFLATQEPFHGDKAAIYIPDSNGDLKRKELALIAQGAHALDTADINNDGDVDIVAGWRGPEKRGVYIFLAPDFVPQRVHSLEGVSGVAIADYNGDSLVDIAFASWGGGDVKEPYITLLTQKSANVVV